MAFIEKANECQWGLATANATQPSPRTKPSFAKDNCVESFKVYCADRLRDRAPAPGSNGTSSLALFASLFDPSYSSKLKTPPEAEQPNWIFFNLLRSCMETARSQAVERSKRESRANGNSLELTLHRRNGKIKTEDSKRKKDFQVHGRDNEKSIFA